MTYISGFVTPVKPENKDAYIESARMAWPLFQEFGALSMNEGWGDNTPDGKVTDFRRAVQAEAALEGRPFTAATFEAAACAVKNDFTPLTDFRATADYRHAVAANFFRRFWLEHSGQEVPVRLNRAVGE